MGKDKLFFLVNKRAGAGTANGQTIAAYCAKMNFELDIFELDRHCERTEIERRILAFEATRVVAVGGDGTLKLLAEAVAKMPIPIGIVPAGSANGMAKELGIPLDFEKALAIACTAATKTIHATKVNGQLCIHLADIGFNAYVVKKFDELPTRGMLTYAKAAWSAFWNHRKMTVELLHDNKKVKQKVAMVVIANATKYGTGVQINPKGKLTDALFEVVLVKEYAVMEILKNWIRNTPFNPKKIEVLQTSSINITAKHKAHFQIDGEYLGKVRQLEACIVPNALQVAMPNQS